MNINDVDVQQVKESIGEELFNELRQHFIDGWLSISDLAQIPQNELENLHQLGRLYVSKSNFAAAAKILKMLVHIHPHSSEFWGTYGIALQNLDDFLKARTAYAVAYELDPKRTDYCVRAAECELMLQNPKYALDILAPVFYTKTEGNEGLEIRKQAQRIKTLAENMESGPQDMDKLEA